MAGDDTGVRPSKRLQRFLNYLRSSLIRKLILTAGPISVLYFVAHFIAILFRGEGVIQSLRPTFYIVAIIVYIVFVYLQCREFWKDKLWEDKRWKDELEG